MWFLLSLSTLNINHRLWQILSKGVITSSKMIKFPYLLMDECTDFVHSSNGLIGTYLYMYIFSHLQFESSLKLVGFLSCRPIRCFKDFWYTIAAFLLLSNLLSINTSNCYICRLFSEFMVGFLGIPLQCKSNVAYSPDKICIDWFI